MLIFSSILIYKKFISFVNKLFLFNLFFLFYDFKEKQCYIWYDKNNDNILFFIKIGFITENKINYNLIHKIKTFRNKSCFSWNGK